MSPLAGRHADPFSMVGKPLPTSFQSGVELNVIKSWLGYVSITITSEYIEIDMAVKRKAIERCAPPAPGPEGESRWHASKDIILWLEDL